MAVRLSFFRWLGAGVLVAASAVAVAQQPPQQPGTSADELLRLGTGVLREIDEDRGLSLWNGTPPFLKAKLPQSEFASGIRKQRESLGTVTQRNWAGIARIQHLDGSLGVPAGLYANVDFATQTSSGKNFYEMLSFKLEPDGWHLTGYIPRDAR
jgi:hypothetical protein